MQLIAIIVAIVSALLWTIGAWIDHRAASMEPIEFTQCFRSFEQGEGAIPKTPPLDKDEVRHCYGQRWKMPRAFYRGHYVSYNPITETAELWISLPDLAPGGTLPKERRKISLYSEVNARALWFGPFAEQVRHIKTINTGFRYVNTGRELFGMEVYEEVSPERGQYGSIFLLPRGDVQLFAECIVSPGLDASTWLKRPHGGCTITANVDDRVYLDYYVKKEDMPEVSQINTRLVSLVRGFMRFDPPNNQARRGNTR